MSLSYELGRRWGKLSFNAKTGVLLGVVVFIGGCVQLQAWQRSQEHQAEQKRAAAAAEAASSAEAKRQLAEKVRLAELKLKCAQQESVIVDKARASLKRGDPSGALDDMKECRLSLDESPLFAAVFKQAGADYDRKVQADRRKVDAEDRARKKREGVRIGMSKEDVLASSWGRPNKINRTTNIRGTSEQWVYDGGYLYFDGDVLTSVQN